MKEIKYRPIGTSHSPFKEPKGTPIQPKVSGGTEGSVEVFSEYAEGLKDLDGFSHIILVYHFHLCNKSSLSVIPYMDEVPHGVFSTRAPGRPNPIGISVVRLVRIEGNIIHVQDIDILDGTPLLDIKPYVSEFDENIVQKKGWLKKNIHKYKGTKDDGRFVD